MIAQISQEKAGNEAASGEAENALKPKDLSDKCVKLSLRVSPELYKQLKAEAKTKGYPTLSGYIRRILEVRK